MGYTLYWYRNKSIDPASFSSILEDFNKILPELALSGVLLAGPDGSGLPLINEYGVYFNGKYESQGCYEPFMFEQNLNFLYQQPRKKNGKYFQYIRTEDLPYGLAAAIFLIIAKQYLKDQINVSSDYSITGWDKPRELCHKILGYGTEFSPESFFEE